MRSIEATFACVFCLQKSGYFSEILDVGLGGHDLKVHFFIGLVGKRTKLFVFAR